MSSGHILNLLWPVWTNHTQRGCKTAPISEAPRKRGHKVWLNRINKIPALSAYIRG